MSYSSEVWQVHGQGAHPKESALLLHHAVAESRRSGETERERKMNSSFSQEPSPQKGGGEPIWVMILIYMELSQGNSVQIS
jgi:hypothetical protein